MQPKQTLLTADERKAAAQTQAELRESVTGPIHLGHCGGFGLFVRCILRGFRNSGN